MSFKGLTLSLPYCYGQYLGAVAIMNLVARECSKLTGDKSWMESMRDVWDVKKAQSSVMGLCDRDAAEVCAAAFRPIRPATAVNPAGARAVLARAAREHLFALL